MRTEVLLGLMILLLSGCGLLSPRPDTPDDLRSVFAVSGSADEVNITFRHAGGSEEYNNVRLPWSKAFEIDVGDQASVFAYATDGGSLTCTWTIDRAADVLDEASARGESGTSVMCGGRWAGFSS